MSILAFTDRDRVTTEIDENSLNLQEIAGKRLNDLMILIAESISNHQKDELIQYLNELSGIVTIRISEQIPAYNDRIKSILTFSKESDSQGNWNKLVTINGVLRNTKGVFIESQDSRTQPNIELVLGLPVSHVAIIAGQSQSSKERELMLLKIYGISIENMNQVLNER